MRRHNDRDMKYKYAKEKLGRVVRYLAIGERDVRDRLRVVSSDIFRLNGDDLPPQLRKHLVWIQRELTKYGPEVCPNGERYKNARFPYAGTYSQFYRPKNSRTNIKNVF